MKARRLLVGALTGAFFAVVFILVGHAVPARAATIHYDGSNDVTAITGLDVGGNLFDISFIFGGESVSYNTVYAPTYPSYANAAAVRDAVVSLLNSSSPNNPDISGSNSSGFSGFKIPTSVTSSTLDIVMAYHSAGGTASYSPNVILSAPLDFDDPKYRYAWSVISSTEVPLPATLPLFASGLGALGLLAWRKKRNVAT